MPGQIISVIGGGGKTTLIRRIGEELVQLGLRVILTTTTKIQILGGIRLVLEDEPDFSSKLRSAIEKTSFALVACRHFRRDRVTGLNPSSVQHLRDFADVVLVEADGARQRSLKAHEEHEPVIPAESATVLILCCGNIIGEELGHANVHRAELFSRKWRLPVGTVLTAEIIATELLSRRGYFAKIPTGASVRFLVNKSDLDETAAKVLAYHLQERCSYPVYWGSLKSNKLESTNRPSNV